MLIQPAPVLLIPTAAGLYRVSLTRSSPTPPGTRGTVSVQLVPKETLEGLRKAKVIPKTAWQESASPILSDDPVEVARALIPEAVRAGRVPTAPKDPHAVIRAVVVP